MNRVILGTVIAASLTACAAGPSSGRDARTLAPRGEPSTVIAAEIAFARAAREDGTWTAFRDFATADAIWPGSAPGPAWESVQTALKGKADPAQPIVWAPDLVWISCDGSFALSTGPATHPDGRKTRFSTLWQRQNNGEYRWVLDQGFDLEPDYAEREMVSGRSADCAAGTPNRVRRLAKARRDEAWQSGRSDDGTLVWTSTRAADCRRTLVVTALQGGAMSEVFRRTSTAPRVAPGAAAPTC